MKLIALWANNVDATVEHPTSVFWGDGRPATLDDYQQHFDDSYTCVCHKDGRTEKHMFADVVVDVTYDQVAGHWAVNGCGVEPFGLHLTDPLAKDEEIIAELTALPMVYRAKIRR